MKSADRRLRNQARATLAIERLATFSLPESERFIAFLIGRAEEAAEDGCRVDPLRFVTESLRACPRHRWEQAERLRVSLRVSADPSSERPSA